VTEKRTLVGKAKIEYYEKRNDKYSDDIDVIGWYTVPTGVLKGSLSKAYCGTFKTEAGAEAVYGEMNWNSPYLEPSMSLDHLPGENDPVPGGMYPDDW
jgi:hypothetical protein